MPPLDLEAAGPPLFAPIVFRLAMKLEQVTWSEFASDASEAVHVLRAARRLFGQELGVGWFDTWLEAEAAGAIVERDDLGRVTGRPQPPVALPPVADVLEAFPVRQAVEIVRRLSLESQQVAGVISGPATLRARLASTTSDPNHIAELSVALARAFCEAGAAALLLTEEEENADLAGLAAFTPLFNLARYYGTPVILYSRHPLSQKGVDAAAATTGGLFVTPTQAGSKVRPLPDDGHGSPRARLALSRWEVDPETAPQTLQAWRQALAPA
jgi:hypothetical protein